LDQACEASANLSQGSVSLESHDIITEYRIISNRIKEMIILALQTRNLLLEANSAESVPPTIFILLIFLLDLLLLGADDVRCNQVTAVAMISLGIRSIAASWIPATALKGSSSTAHCGRVVSSC